MPARAYLDSKLGLRYALRGGVRCAVLTVCTGVVLCAGLASAAQATRVAGITPSFSPDKPGAPTAMTLALHYSGPENEIPLAVSRVVVHLPEGLGLYPPRRSRTCSRAQLQAHGPTGCPSFAKVGSGSALLGAHLGTLNLSESASLTAWAGPEQGGNPTLEIAGQGLSPLEERVVATGVLEPDNPPYGMELALNIPPIPTLPTEPDASVLRFSLTLGSTGRAHGVKGGAELVRVPKHCPSGGFPFAMSFTYANGSSGEASAKVACP
jgi:hypothetical protein